MTIHKEGHKILIYLLAVLTVINLAVIFTYPEWYKLMALVATFSLVIFLLILQFFRSPKRLLTMNDKYVIAPADGKVVVIEEVEDSEYFNDKRKQVSIFMSPVNVHVNRNPITGIVKYFKYHQGKYLVAWHPKASLENERTTIVVEDGKKNAVLIRQIAGALAKRIVWYLNTGDVVKQGEELGFIKFGSRVDLLLPLDAKVMVKLGEKTLGGVTVIAELPE